MTIAPRGNKAAVFRCSPNSSQVLYAAAVTITTAAKAIPIHNHPVCKNIFRAKIIYGVNKKPRTIETCQVASGTDRFMARNIFFRQPVHISLRPKYIRIENNCFASATSNLSPAFLARFAISTSSNTSAFPASCPPIFSYELRRNIRNAPNPIALS